MPCVGNTRMKQQFNQDPVQPLIQCTSQNLTLECPDHVCVKNSIHIEICHCTMWLWSNNNSSGNLVDRSRPHSAQDAPGLLSPGSQDMLQSSHQFVAHAV